MKLKEIRTKKGLTQQQLAEELQVGRQTISRYEKGTRELSAEMIIKIVEILDCSADELLGIKKK